MNAINLASIKKTNWKHSLRVFLGILALFMAGALLFTACKKSEEGGEKAVKGQAEFEKGLASLEKKEYEDAAKSFKEAAEKGNTEAMVAYAFCLAGGKGVEKNKEEAKKWFRKAADTGDAMAQAAYGMIKIAEDKEKGFEYLKKSADQNFLWGQVLLGTFYCFEGNGEDDVKKGLEYLKKVASQPLTDKKIVLDSLKEIFPLDVMNGAAGFDIDLKGDKKNVSNMFVVVSQIGLGGFYADKGDFAEARKWFRTAGDNGFVQADDFLKKLHEEEYPTKSEYEVMPE